MRSKRIDHRVIAPFTRMPVRKRKEIIVTRFEATLMPLILLVTTDCTARTAASFLHERYAIFNLE